MKKLSLYLYLSIYLSIQWNTLQLFNEQTRPTEINMITSIKHTVETKTNGPILTQKFKHTKVYPIISRRMLIHPPAIKRAKHE